jgi:hypothetical protein
MRDCFPARLSSQARGRRKTAAHRDGSDVIFAGFGENAAERGCFLKAATIPGAYADFVAIEADRLKDNEAVRRVRWLMKAGAVKVDKR